MIPKEIDEMMWTVAEGNDPSAIEAFGNRYPNLREELLKRIRTVNALKSGNRPIKVSKVPTFQNTKVERTNLHLAWGSLAFAAVAVLSFAVYRGTHRPEAPQPVAPIQIGTPKTVDPTIQPNPPKGMEPMAIPHGNNGGNPNGANNYPTLPETTNTEPITTNSLKTLHLESAPLQTAILLIGEAGHFTVTIAPGMPNPTVKIDYVDMEPMEMMKQLGEEYAFTPVMDGPRAILILPKKDEDEGQITGNH